MYFFSYCSNEALFGIETLDSVSCGRNCAFNVFVLRVLLLIELAI